MAALNVVKAGRAIPIKFSLSGDYGLGIMAAGYPASAPIACDNSAPTDAIGRNGVGRFQQSLLRPGHRSVHLRLEDEQNVGQ
jgi:hypothetical protein